MNIFYLPAVENKTFLEYLLPNCSNQLLIPSHHPVISMWQCVICGVRLFSFTFELLKAWFSVQNMFVVDEQSDFQKPFTVKRKRVCVLFAKQVNRLWEMSALLRSSTANVFGIENHVCLRWLSDVYGTSQQRIIDAMLWRNIVNRFRSTRFRYTSNVQLEHMGVQCLKPPHFFISGTRNSKIAVFVGLVGKFPKI